MQKCKKHSIELECIGGRSAHASNWYCPECDKNKNEHINNNTHSKKLTIGRLSSVSFISCKIESN